MTLTSEGPAPNSQLDAKGHNPPTSTSAWTVSFESADTIKAICPRAWQAMQPDPGQRAYKPRSRTLQHIASEPEADRPNSLPEKFSAKKHQTSLCDDFTEQNEEICAFMGLCDGVRIFS